MYVATIPSIVHCLPIGTTALALVFLIVLLRRYAARGTGTHLLWWAFGVFCYGAGTALESSITLWGNSVALNKAWYVAGAVLGGYPLAQGTVYLLLRRRTAHILTAVTVPLIVILSTLVLLSPANTDVLEPNRPSGAILAWWWVRFLTPAINGYAAFFLVGGAILSAVRYSRHVGSANRALGNTLIAVGALLPGVGGGLAKAGLVEALYVGELIGMVLIWLGYTACVRRPSAATAQPAETADGTPCV